jgi:protein-S-isoprenylcysteine O-methyltransferase Ste14
VGVALMLVGAAGIATARYQLGKSFSLTPQARQLVTRGIYSKIRNPIYVSGGVMLAGFVLVLHRPVLWLVLLALIIMQTLRARREAQVLEAAFGDAYREYRRRTWF